MDRINPAASRAVGSALGGAGVKLRPHRMLPLNKELLGKFPKELGESEFNVALGLGSRTNAGAGVAAFNQNTPRDCILRRLYVDDGNVRGRVSSFQIGGENVVIGDSFPVAAFRATTFVSPEFDFYSKAGTPIQVSITYDAAFTADAGFSID